MNETVTSYRETPAPPALAHWVECYWELRARYVSPPIVTRIIPDGSADLVFHLGDVPAAPDENARADVHRGASPRAYVVGTLLRSVDIQYARDTHVVGASLRPAGVREVLEVESHAIADRVEPLAGASGAVGERLSRAVFDGPPETAMHRLNAELLDCARSFSVPDLAASAAVRLIRESGGLISMQALGLMLALPPRQLERRFSAAVGMPPKVFARLARFGGVVRRLRGRGLERGWATLAVEHGYHDQAHLVHEVRAFAGLTPAALLAEIHRVGFVQYDPTPRR